MGAVNVKLFLFRDESVNEMNAWRGAWLPWRSPGDSRPDGIGDELAMDNYDGTVIRLYVHLFTSV